MKIQGVTSVYQSSNSCKKEKRNDKNKSKVNSDKSKLENSTSFKDILIKKGIYT